MSKQTDGTSYRARVAAIIGAHAAQPQAATPLLAAAAFEEHARRRKEHAREMRRRRARRDRTLPLGTISSGTLVAVDIFPALLDELSSLRLSIGDRRALRKLGAEFDALPNDENRDDDARSGDSAERADELLDELTEIAGNCVPDFCYYGSIEGDGAEFGVWISWDSVRDAQHSGEIAATRDCATCGRDKHGSDAQCYALEVNDHGNATLYARAGAGRVWREVWSVV